MIKSGNVFNDLYTYLNTWKECMICGFMCAFEEMYDRDICEDCNSNVNDKLNQ